MLSGQWGLGVVGQGLGVVGVKGWWSLGSGSRCSGVKGWGSRGGGV